MLNKAHYATDILFLDSLARDDLHEFLKWMEELEQANVALGSPYGKSMWTATGAACWYDYYDEGISPDAALREDMSYGL